MEIRYYRPSQRHVQAAMRGVTNIEGRLTSYADLSKCDLSISDHTISPSNALMHLMRITNKSVFSFLHQLTTWHCSHMQLIAVQLPDAPLQIHRVTVTYFRSLYMPAGPRRHIVGKTLRNVC